MATYLNPSLPISQSPVVVCMVVDGSPEFVETCNLRNHVVFNYHRGRRRLDGWMDGWYNMDIM